MTRKATASPFAGIKLSEHAAPSAGPDQLLFSTRSMPSSPVASPTKENQGTLQSRKVGSKESRDLDYKVSASSVAQSEESSFDLAQAPYRNDTFSFTDAELDAIEDMKIDLRRRFDTRATKNSLVRCAIHMLIEDYRRKKGDSFAARRLRKEQP